MYRFYVKSSPPSHNNTPTVDRRDVSLGGTLKMLMFEFDCSIPIGREHLAWAADQLVCLDVGNGIRIGQLNITRAV